MDLFDEIFDYNHDGKLDSWERLDRDISNNIAYQNLHKNNKSPASFGSGGQGCYIATCVYGSYDCPQVWTLRRFRDTVLAKNCFGRVFIHFYYAISPKLVKIFGEKAWFCDIWHRRLDKLVDILHIRGIGDEPYQDLAQ